MIEIFLYTGTSLEKLDILGEFYKLLLQILTLTNKNIPSPKAIFSPQDRRKITANSKILTHKNSPDPFSIALNNFVLETVKKMNEKIRRELGRLNGGYGGFDSVEKVED